MEASIEAVKLDKLTPAKIQHWKQSFVAERAVILSNCGPFALPQTLFCGVRSRYSRQMSQSIYRLCFPIHCRSMG
jgi:hypothetical protein